MERVMVLYFTHQKEHLQQLDMISCYYRYRIRCFCEVTLFPSLSCSAT